MIVFRTSYYCKKDQGLFPTRSRSRSRSRTGTGHRHRDRHTHTHANSLSRSLAALSVLCAIFLEQNSCPPSLFHTLSHSHARCLAYIRTRTAPGVVSIRYFSLLLSLSLSLALLPTTRGRVVRGTSTRHARALNSGRERKAAMQFLSL
jgi:hypothetical protein